ncbi:MAG TPA: PAS domain-containing hybrid sensor histidine kinase/response regulator [Candidatus Brocadiia bacterium]|nr:PAS domain S-box protein [Planctomycetota bacterium]MDO8091956.1 PAS domain S-box protein [Candidatus Brocadiales bacterium]
MENLVTSKKVNFRRITDPEVSRVVTNNQEKSQEDLKRKLVQRTEAFLESEEKYRTLFEMANDGIAIIDPETAKFVEVNKKLEETIGYSREELKKMEVFDVCLKKEHKKIAKKFNDVLKGGSGFYNDLTLKKKGGGVVIANISSSVVLHRKGVRIFSIVRDITERKGLIEKSSESEARYKALVENIPEAVYTILPDGTYTFMNAAIKKITGFKPVEFYRDKNLWIKQVHPEDRKKVLKQLSELWNGVALRREYKFVHKNGVDVIWFIDNAIPNIDKKGRIVSAYGVMIDITEKRKIYEQLLQAEKMAALGILSGGIAHEFNNLHTIILSSLQLAMQNKKLSTDTKTYLKETFQTSCRLSDLTSQLLFFARKKPPKREKVDIKKIIQETLKIVQHEFLCEGINIVTSYSKDVSPLFVDPGQMSQVFLNVMINAKHAMHKSKEKCLTIEVGQQDNVVHIAFSDTGSGIEEEAIPKLFEPFYTTKGSFGNGTYENKIPGTGLGLSVSDSIVREHGGRIEVKSKVNIGSTFTILLPIRQVDIEVRRKGDAKEKYGSIKGAKILVLDDEPGIRRILKNIFENKGCIVSACESGEAAIEELNMNESYDLAIVDLQLPGLNGYGFIKEINRISCDRRPQKMVLTGKLLSSENIKVLGKLGVYDIISKPFDNNVLYERVCAALSHSKQ